MLKTFAGHAGKPESLRHFEPQAPFPEMNDDIILTPAGHLRWRNDGHAGLARPDAWTKRVAAAFSSGEAPGLFALAATPPAGPPAPVFSFWRDFACRYLTQLCRTATVAGSPIEPLQPPMEAELAAMQLAAPPCRGVNT